MKRKMLPFLIVIVAGLTLWGCESENGEIANSEPMVVDVDADKGLPPLIPIPIDFEIDVEGIENILEISSTSDYWYPMDFYFADGLSMETIAVGTGTKWAPGSEVSVTVITGTVPSGGFTQPIQVLLPRLPYNLDENTTVYKFHNKPIGFELAVTITSGSLFHGQLDAPTGVHTYRCWRDMPVTDIEFFDLHYEVYDGSSTITFPMIEDREERDCEGGAQTEERAEDGTDPLDDGGSEDNGTGGNFGF